MLTSHQTGLHYVRWTVNLTSGDVSMRRLIAIAGLMAALSFGAAPACAFQETPVPPAAPGEAPQAAPTAPAMQLGTPAGTVAPQEKQGGLNLFG